MLQRLVSKSVRYCSCKGLSPLLTLADRLLHIENKLTSLLRLIREGRPAVVNRESVNHIFHKEFLVCRVSNFFLIGRVAEMAPKKACAEEGRLNGRPDYELLEIR